MLFIIFFYISILHFLLKKRAQQTNKNCDRGPNTPKSRVMIVSPGVGASWARSSGSSFSLVKSASPGSPATPAPPAVKKVFMWRGLNSDSVCSREKIIDFSSMSLWDRRR